MDTGFASVTGFRKYGSAEQFLLSCPFIHPTCAMAPTTATNNKVINNTITNTELTNNSGNGAPGFGYQAGVYESGNNDKVINNDISGAGYDPSGCMVKPGVETCAVDSSSGLVVKNHANSFGP